MATTPHINRHWSWHPESWRPDAVGAAVGAKTAVERVYIRVSSDIVGGTLAGGSLVTEGEIAEQFNVSRTPVREAFLLMEAQGLLRLYPKKGAVVTTPNPEENAHLRQVRIMLESRAVELQTTASARAGSAPAPGPGPDSIVAADSTLRTTTAADLAALIAVQRGAADNADIPAFARADHQFHARVVAGSGNPIIDDFYAQLGPRLARLTCLTVHANTAALQRFVDEHTELASRLAAADHRGYELLLQRHIGAP